jgi:hypothetical protein
MYLFKDESSLHARQKSLASWKGGQVEEGRSGVLTKLARMVRNPL